MITLSEGPANINGYVVQSTADLSKDVFNHKDLGGSFKFSTGIGPFQLDHGGTEPDEPWTTMTTLDKTDPEKSLRSTLRWHNVTFGSKWDGASPPTLSDFYTKSGWYGPGRIMDSGDFKPLWNNITDSDWDSVKDIYQDVAFHPLNGSYPYENYVKKVGSNYWNILGGYYDTWLMKGKSGGYSKDFYYTYNDTLEIWVYNDTTKNHGFIRKYSQTQLPQDNSGNTITLGTTTAGFTYDTKIVSVGLISLPKTEQTASYATGDDGDKHIGIAWPSPRFNDNGNGTVTDKLTGLMWLKDGDCSKNSTYDTDGVVTWSSAFGFADSVNGGRDISACSYSGDAHNDWRVPNINELKSLFNAGYPSESCGGSACSTDADWLNEHGFISMKPDMYWSSTTSAYNTNEAWTVHFWDGQVGVTYKVNEAFRVTLVRGISDGPAKIAATEQRASYNGKKDDGYYELGVVPPNSRFTDEGDGTVTDSLTGLVWLKDANCFGNTSQISWDDSLSKIADFNTTPGNYSCEGYTGTYKDWRMPNRIEMQSLVNFSNATPALTIGYPFVNVQSSYAYWTSTAYPLSPSSAVMVMQMWDGGLAAWYKDGNTAYVWPVRD